MLYYNHRGTQGDPLERVGERRVPQIPIAPHWYAVPKEVLKGEPVKKVAERQFFFIKSIDTAGTLCYTIITEREKHTNTTIHRERG